MNMDRLMLKPAEAAELLGIGRTKVYELIRADLIPYRRVGRSLRVPVALLKAWVETPENRERLREAPSRRK
jgi:excisionase family DNA binding protein